MTTLLLTWMFWNAVIGGLLVTAGAWWAGRHRSPVRRLRLLEWTLVASLVAPLLVTVQLPWRWSLKWLPAEHSLAANDPSITTPMAEPTKAISTSDVSLRADIASSFETKIGDAELAGTPRAAPVPPVVHRSFGRSFVTMGSALIAIQLAAMAAVVGWWLLSVIALARLWRRAAQADTRVMQLLPQLQTGSFPTTVDVRVSPGLPTACAFGLGRWCILLPETFVERDESDQIRFALAHEWSHLVRGDLWTWRLARFAQLALWFQPAYWWLRHQVRLCQDYLADADAVETGSPADFAAFLVQCVRHQLSPSLATALPLSCRSSDLTRRVTMLLAQSSPLERRCPRSLQAIALCVVALTLTAAAFVRVEAQDAGPQTDQKQESAPSADPNGETLTYKCRVITHGTEAPIAGATIRVKRSLYGDPRYPKSHAIETTTHTTDADGYYTVVIPAEQTRQRYLYIELDVEHSQHMAKRGFGYAMSMTLKNERLGERPFFETTKLYAAQAVTGRLVRSGGEAAANVKITGYQFPGESPWVPGEGHSGSFFEARTEADGKFSLPIVTPGKGAFWFQPDDAAPRGIVAPEQRGDLGEIKLADGFRVKGRVLDAEGMPIAGVHVSAQRTSSESPEVDKFNQTSAAVGGYARSGNTNDQGEFELAPIDAGQYEFRVAEYEKTHGSAKFSGVFVNRNINVTKAEEPLEFRALPTVKITARNVNAAGEPRRGFEFTVFGWIAEGGGWFAAQSSRPEDGVCVAEVPQGLGNVQLRFMDNEHGSYRIRRSPGAELEGVRELKLGTVDADVTGIEVVRYKAPVLLVKAVDPDGNSIADFQLSGRRMQPDDAKADSAFDQSVVSFEKQQDGRWRSSQMLPDETVTVTVAKPGWKADAQEVSLPEGEERELVFAMLRE